MADTRYGQLADGTPTGTSIIAFSENGITYGGTCQEFKNPIINPGTILGQVFKVTAANTAAMIDDDFCVNITIGDGGTALAQTGIYPYWQAGYNGVWESIDMMSGTTVGNATIKVYKGNYGTPPVGTAQSILGAIGTEVITFTGGTKAQGTPTVTAFVKGDIFTIDLIGSGTIKFLSTMLKGRKTAIS
jgi:hypothetical protein